MLFYFFQTRHRLDCPLAGGAQSTRCIGKSDQFLKFFTPQDLHRPFHIQ